MKKYLFICFAFIISCQSMGLRSPSSQENQMSTALGSDMQIDEKFEYFEAPEGSLEGPGQGSFSSEKLIHDKLISTSKELMEKMFNAANQEGKTFPMTRDAHAKSHGCLKAKFKVFFPKKEPLLQKHRVGIFAEDKVYSAWLRFSNNDHLPFRRDNEYDLRGASIKVMGVEGQKIMSGFESAPTQDFLMYGSKVFFVANNKDYVGFIEGLRDDNATTRLLTEQPVAAFKTRKAQWLIRNHINPLTLSYFSATPVRLGTDEQRTAMKYALKPCKSNDIVSPKDKTETHYMRKNLKASIEKLASKIKKGQKASLCFDFQIQVQADPLRMPIEDATVVWPEEEMDYGNLLYAPYITVAELEILNQEFDTLERDRYCENLSFTPWHALVEHKPLGRTMRMRRDLYRATSEFRRHTNKVPSLAEPHDFEIE